MWWHPKTSRLCTSSLKGWNTIKTCQGGEPVNFYGVGMRLSVVSAASGKLLMQVQLPGVARASPPRVHFHWWSLMCSYSLRDRVELHALTYVCMLKIPSNGSHTAVWTPQNKAKTWGIKNRPPPTPPSHQFFYFYSPLTFKCTQEFVLVMFHSYNALTNRQNITISQVSKL